MTDSDAQPRRTPGRSRRPCSRPAAGSNHRSRSSSARSADAAQQPPSVVVAPVDKHASTADLIRHLTASSVIQILMHDPGVRLGTIPRPCICIASRPVGSAPTSARSRACSTTMSPTSSAPSCAGWAQAAGPVRDLDVLGARFEAHARDLSDVDQAAASAASARLAARRFDATPTATPRSAPVRSLRPDAAHARRLRGRATCSRRLGAASEPNRPPASRRRSCGRRWNQLAEAVEAAGDDPTDAQLHQIRIAAKRCRYAAEALAPVVGRPARRFAARDRRGANRVGRLPRHRRRRSVAPRRRRRARRLSHRDRRPHRARTQEAGEALQGLARCLAPGVEEEDSCLVLERALGLRQHSRHERHNDAGVDCQPARPDR